MLKNTFFGKSYLSWIENKNILAGAEGKKNLVENFFFMANKIQPLILINPIVGLIVLGIGQFFLASLGLLSLLILSSLIQFQFAPHYLYPTAFFLFFVVVILLSESRYQILLVLMLFFEIIFFPKQIYNRSTITPEPFEAAVKYSIVNHLVEKNSKFNVAMIAHPNAILGFEYRYFFQKYGLTPMREFEYSASDVLLLFTNKADLDPTSLNTWETNQFGKKYLQKIIRRGYRHRRSRIDFVFLRFL